jgi:hypothetical protein
MVSKRSSPRTQGEYREVLEQMKNEVLKVHYWAKHFLKNRKQDAAKTLDNYIEEEYKSRKITDTLRIELIKQVDILRG